MKTGSLEQPFKRTPRVVGSTKKWRTNSSPVPFNGTPGGGWATFNTKPNAFANLFKRKTITIISNADIEITYGRSQRSVGRGSRTRITINHRFTYVVESRTKKLPGGAFRKSAIASSREIVGLYQNFDESRTNLCWNKWFHENAWKIKLIKWCAVMRSFRHILTLPNAVQFPAVRYLQSMWLNYDVMCSTRHHFDLYDVYVLQSIIPCCYFKQDIRNIQFFQHRIGDMQRKCYLEWQKLMVFINRY